MNSYGYDNALRKRLAQLRVQKGVSAREMSLALGQNTGYISNIESGKTLPSMTGFFYICEYLDISPCDFFDFDTQAPKEASEMMSRLKRLNAVQLNHVAAIVEDILSNTAHRGIAAICCSAFTKRTACRRVLPTRQHSSR